MRAQAKKRGASSVSAFVAEILAEKLEHDGLKEVLDEIFADQPMTEEERNWADQLLFGQGGTTVEDQPSAPSDHP